MMSDQQSSKQDKQEQGKKKNLQITQGFFPSRPMNDEELQK